MEDYFPEVTQLMVECGIALQDEFTCLHCDAKYLCRNDLKNHICQAELCEMCNNSFPKKTLLKSHQYYVHGMGFQCNECKYCENGY